MSNNVAVSKIAFAIYQESAYKPDYQVIYFTELDERRRDHDIAKVMAGQIVWDGFLKDDDRKPQGKALIAAYLIELASSGNFSSEEFEKRLSGFLA